MAVTLEHPTYEFWKLTIGAAATIGIYSVLYRETKFYRFFEHMFLGLAAGWSITALWTENLYQNWWLKLVGSQAEGTEKAQPGYWAWIMILPLGFLAYTIFSRKHNWLSRIPIGILIGLGSGQAILNWFKLYGPQIDNSIKTVVPTVNDSALVPSKLGADAARLAEIANNVYVSQAINNVIFLFTLLSVFSYFIFCTEFKNKFMKSTTVAGRLILMVGFGAIFGATVMTRFALLIDRMYFVWVEWFIEKVLQR